MQAGENPKYWHPKDVKLSFVGCQDWAQFNNNLLKAFHPFIVPQNGSIVAAAKYFQGTGPAITTKCDSMGYPNFKFGIYDQVPTRIVVRIYNVAIPQAGHCHFSGRLIAPYTTGALSTVNSRYLWWWRKVGGSATESQRYVWCQSPDTYTRQNLGSLAAAHTTVITIYPKAALRDMNMLGANYRGCGLRFFNLFNYPATDTLPAGNYPAAYYVRLNGLEFYWDD